MFLFNACLMGYEEAEWMDIILDRMDCILCNVAQLQRLQALGPSGPDGEMM
ncbi:unnamed protein product [Durusdinium trenchii]|uniref:Uncharacterized protein n=1 Tax=Durusdinium trenchii TaxID=1381693 RepID=A0ABP0SI94_9DINO